MQFLYCAYGTTRAGESSALFLRTFPDGLTGTDKIVLKGNTLTITFADENLKVALGFKLGVITASSIVAERTGLELK